MTLPEGYGKTPLWRRCRAGWAVRETIVVLCVSGKSGQLNRIDVSR